MPGIEFSLRGCFKASSMLVFGFSASCKVLAILLFVNIGDKAKPAPVKDEILKKFLLESLLDFIFDSLFVVEGKVETCNLIISSIIYLRIKSVLVSYIFV